MTIGKSIFVFGGGTNETYLEFSRDPSSASKEEGAAFARAKGPDFVSRLSAHINTHGINPYKKDESRMYFLRRAVQIRSMLEERGLVGPAEKPIVDIGYLEYLLKVRLYKHGARSLRMIFDSSIGDNGYVNVLSVNQRRMHIEET
jgi:hypothetical protein